jgi:hypothetical protein
MTKLLTQPPGLSDSPRDQKVHLTPPNWTAFSLQKQMHGGNYAKKINLKK